MAKTVKLDRKMHRADLKMRMDGVAPAPHSDIMKIAAQLAGNRSDGWASAVSGLGIAGRDKRTAGRVEWTGLLYNEQVCEALVAGSNLARRVIEYLPYEATRLWIKLKNVEADEKKIQEEWDRINARANFFKAWCWARTFGGGALLMVTDEGGGNPNKIMATGDGPLSKPMLDDDGEVIPFKRLKSLIPLNRYELDPWSSDIETDLTSPNFRMPRYYRLRVISGGIRVPINVKIHHSRLILFQGQELPPLLFLRNKYWHDSIFTGLMEAMRDYDMSHSGVAQVLNEYRMIVHKMPDLAGLIASGGESKLKARIQAALASRNTTGVMYADTEEEVEIKSETFAGVTDILNKMADRFAAQTEYPKIILFNESPEGSMGGNGNSEMENWYNTVEARQNTYLAPKIDQFLKVFFAATEGPLAGVEPPDWDYDFDKLWQETGKEKADREQVEATTDGLRIQQGVQDEVDIIEKRFPEKLEDQDPEELRKEIEAEKQKQMEMEHQQNVELKTAQPVQKPPIKK